MSITVTYDTICGLCGKRRGDHYSTHNQGILVVYCQPIGDKDWQPWRQFKMMNDFKKQMDPNLLFKYTRKGR
jgi:hypothetical protein